jgi:hypothetical protein
MVASSEIICKLSFMKIGHLAEKFEVESVISLSPLFAIFREDVLSKIPAKHLGGHVARGGKRRVAHRVLVGKSAEKRPLGRPRRR